MQNKFENPSTSIVFIATGYYRNGGTTFLLRILFQLNKIGARVGVLFLKNQGDQGLLEDLKKVAEVKFSGSKFRFPFSCFVREDDQLTRWLQRFNHVHVMGFFGAIKCMRMGSNRVISLGVYQESEYLNEFTKLNSLNRLTTDMLKVFDHYIFFNEVNRDKYCSHYDLCMNNCSVVPIGISFKPISSCEKQFDIVTVGNLMPFKSYIVQMIRTLALDPRCRNLNYHIYGDGPQRTEIFDLIQVLGVNDRVQLKKSFEYDRFESVVSKYCCFFGSGTALLEASMLGIPALTGIENVESSKTYGYLTDFTGYSYNENGIDRECYSIGDKLNELFFTSHSCRLSALSFHERAREFTIDHTVQVFEKLSQNENCERKKFHITKIFLFAILLISAEISARLKGYSLRDRKSL